MFPARNAGSIGSRNLREEYNAGSARPNLETQLYGSKERAEDSEIGSVTLSSSSVKF